MGDVVIKFRTHVSELLQDPVDRLTQIFDGQIGLYDEEADDEIVPIGSLQAHLIPIVKLLDAGWDLFDFYDCQSSHLADAVDLIYDCEEDEFRDKILKTAGIHLEDMVEWHLNITRMDIATEHRGQCYGVRAMLLLKQLLERPGLLVTAKAFPQPREGSKAPSRQEVKKLRAYYASEPKLRFKAVGKATDGWLAADWST